MAIWCGFCLRHCSAFKMKGEIVDTAILLSEVVLAAGFMVYIVRSLMERIQELD